MQNSYGKLEHSNIKCSPIFQKLDSQNNKGENHDVVMNNFPYSSLMRNKAGIIRSNFDFNGRLPDAMTPYYKRAEKFSDSIDNCEVTRHNIERDQERNNESNFTDIERGKMATPLSSYVKDSFQHNKNIIDLNFNVGKLKMPNPPGSGTRVHNSAFLLNYNNIAIDNFKNNSKNYLLEANANDTVHYERKKSSNFPNFNNVNNAHNLNKNDPFFYSPQAPTVFSSIMGSTSGSGLKPTSSLFMGRSPSNNGRPVSLTIINNNNYNVNTSQPKIKIREVIQLEDYNIELKGKRKGKRKKLQSYNNVYSSAEVSEEEVFEDQVQDSNDEREESEQEVLEENYQGKLLKNKSNNNNKKSKKNKSNTNTKKLKLIKSKGRREKHNTRIKSKAEDRQDSLLNSDNKVKSIKNIIDSSNSLQKRGAVKRGAYKKKGCVDKFDNQNKEQTAPDNLETNKFTKKILQDTINNYTSQSKKDSFNMNVRISTNTGNITTNQIYTQREEEENLFKDKKRKLMRSKKTDKTRSEISIVEKNDPMAFKDIEYLLSDIPEDEKHNNSCSFYNPSLKNEFLLYVSKGKSNETKLSFGSNPLTIYQDLAEWYLKEKKKLECSKQLGDNVTQTTELCRKIKDELNQVSLIISSLPVLKKPGEEKKQSFLSRKRRKHFIAETDKRFKCDVCVKEGREQYFETGQGLGGHMSRVHKGESEKFNKKKEIRSKREDFRKILVEAKKKMLSDNGFDYEFLDKNKEGKIQIKHFIKNHREKYRKLVRELRKISLRR